MNNASLELGGTNWAEKDGNILGYSVGDTSGKYSPQEFTFARGSNLSATRIDKAGLIVKGRENVMLQSNQFDTSPWSTTRATFVGGQAGYDGSNDSWAFVDNTNNSTHLIVQTITLSSVATFSVYAKAGAVNFIAFRYEDANVDYAYFDLANGTLGTIDSDYIDAKITSVGNGWYRCEASRTSANKVVLLAAQSNGDPTYAGAGTTALYIQDAQLELGLAASPYIETTTTTAQAGVLENTPRLNYTTGVANPYLLLEPSRSNVIAQSEYYNTYWNINDVTIEDNSAISPEGLQNASKITEAATNARHRLGSGSTTLSTSGVYIASVFIKKGTARYGFVHFSGAGAYTMVVDLEDGTITDTITSGTIAYQNVEDYGNGWYRCSVGGDITAGTASYLMQFGTAGSAEPTYFNYVPIFLGSTSNNIYTYGATLEAGTYPTSYIPTYSVSATRASDNCYKTDASDVIGQTEGTMFVEVDLNHTSAVNDYILQVSESSANRILLYKHSTNKIGCFALIGSTAIYTQLTSGAFTGINKIAFAYKSGDFAFYVNGTQIGTSTATFSTSATFDRLDIDSYILVENGFFNYNQVALYKERLTNAELATLTTI